MSIFSIVSPFRLLFCCSLLILVTACGPSEPILISGSTMGTTYSVKVIDEVDRDQLAAAIEARLVGINDLMSTYIPTSEISRLNRLPVGESLQISAENVLMLELGEMLNRQSNGRFDITIGPLISLWGFGPDPSRTTVPPAEAIQQAIAHLGLEGLRIENGKVTKIREVEVSFSAIAMG
jgi:thiamine biosynthesis lipoprotein